MIINLSWPTRYCGHPYTLQPLYLVMLVKGWILYHLQNCFLSAILSSFDKITQLLQPCGLVIYDENLSFHHIPKLLYRTEIFSFWTVLCKPWRSADSNLLRAAHLAPTIRLCSKSKVKSPIFHSDVSLNFSRLSGGRLHPGWVKLLIGALDTCITLVCKIKMCKMVFVCVL